MGEAAAPPARAPHPLRRVPAQVPGRPRPAAEPVPGVQRVGPGPQRLEPRLRIDELRVVGAASEVLGREADPGVASEDPGAVAETTGIGRLTEMARRPSRWLPVFLIAVCLGQTLLSTQVKELVDRIRPTANPIAHTLGPSFPSGHTTGAAAFALVLGRGRFRNTQAVLAGAAVFVACAVAASRVLLGVHWLTDVLGGLALGWAWFALCSIAFGGRLLRLGAPMEAAERFNEAAARTSTSGRPHPLSRA